VRLADGTIIDADIVVSTASAPETVLRLLGGRYGAAETRQRMEHRKMFQPVVLASYGVATPLTGVPSSLLIDHVEPITVGGVRNEHLYVRIYNEDESFAPPGHTVVQAMLETDYTHWAKTGSQYNAEKDSLGALVLKRLDRHLPGMREAAQVSDLATPLTFWNAARSWRGAYEGWLPTPDAMFGHVKKVLPGLSGFYMAGQWVEPGGGVPTALLSGRHVTQLICADEGRAFSSRADGERVEAQAV
jgi:phytoene dehydrogenase-like protein